MKNIVKRFNNYLSEEYFLRFKYQPSVLCFLIHKIYPTRSDIVASNGTTSEGLTKNQFEELIIFFKKRNFIFIDESYFIEGKIEPSEKYVYLTFDDGYFNNFNALDILTKYNVKATFYITTNHCLEGKNYWWDILFKQRAQQNCSNEELIKEFKYFYSIKWQEQESILRSEFGEEVFVPNNDLMRPMSPKELIRFASNSNVRIGNHTHNHLNLSIYSEAEVIDSLNEAKKFLCNSVDRDIQSIAYPYGFYSENILNTIAKLDYKIGHTCNAKTNYLDNLNMLKFNRISVSGYYDIETQCRNHYVNFSILRQIKQSLYK